MDQPEFNESYIQEQFEGIASAMEQDFEPIHVVEQKVYDDKLNQLNKNLKDKLFLGGMCVATSVVFMGDVMKPLGNMIMASGIGFCIGSVACRVIDQYKLKHSIVNIEHTK